MIKFSSLIVILSFTIPSIAQKAPIKWKEVPMEDLQMTSYSLDTSAVAIVLCDYGQYYFDTNPNGQNLFLFNTRHVRIKILKEEGLKYAKVSIPFIDRICEKFPEENSIVIKGMVYNLSETGELEVSRLRKKNITYRDSTNCIQVAEFNLPGVKPGSVIDYYYQKPTLDFVAPKSWYFQWEIPVRHSELRMRSPRYFQYMFSPMNFESFDVVEETDYSRTLLFTTRYGGYRYNRTYHFDLSGKQLQFVKKYIEKADYEKFIHNPENYLQKMNIHLVKATKENYGGAWEYLTHALFTTTVDGYENYQPIQRQSIFYPAGFIIYALPDWEKFTEQLLKSDRFGLPLMKFWEYQPYLNNMIDGKESDFDKMLAIYNYIRKNIKWTGEHDIYVHSVFNPGLSKIYTKITKKVIKEKSLNKPFQDKEGSSSEINFILISLLNKAGIKAYPIIISTRDNEQVDINIPDPKQFNHVLAMAKIGEEDILLDATDSLRPYNILDKSHLVRDGFLVKAKDFGWVEIANREKTSTSITENIEVDSSLNLKSSIVIEKTGYDALEIRRGIQNNNRDKTIQLIEQETGDGKIDEIKNLNDEELPLVFEIKSSKKLNYNELVIKPRLNPVYSERDFSEFFRKYPVEFDYPYSKRYLLEIKLPDGFECILPENKDFSTYGGNAYFSYKAFKENNKVGLVIILEIKKSSFPNIEYTNLAQLFTMLNEKLNENIIISLHHTGI